MFFGESLVPYLYLGRSKMLISIKFLVLYWEVGGGRFARDWCMIFLRPLIFRGFVVPIVADFGQ